MFGFNAVFMSYGCWHFELPGVGGYERDVDRKTGLTVLQWCNVGLSTYNNILRTR